MSYLSATGLPTTTKNQPLPPELQCTYPSKICTNPRAVKQDKKLHRLCEFHRRKANLNQHHMQQRRRMLQREAATKNTPNDVASEDVSRVDKFTDLVNQFSPEELKILESMLFDAEVDVGSDESHWDTRS
ncbi:hypothetical protein FI667_g7473, partial [Globisporangium splendens]